MQDVVLDNIVLEVVEMKIHFLIDKICENCQIGSFQLHHKLTFSLHTFIDILTNFGSNPAPPLTPRLLDLLINLKLTSSKGFKDTKPKNYENGNPERKITVPAERKLQSSTALLHQTALF